MTKLIFTTWANQPMSNMRASSDAWRCASLVGSSGSFQLFFFKNIFSLFIIQYKRAQLGRYASLVYFGSTKLKYFNTKRSEMRNCCNIVHFYIHFDMLIPRFYLLLWWCCLESPPTSCHPPTTWPFGPPPTRPHWRDVHVNAHVILFL